jgi:hypothetical protein
MHHPPFKPDNGRTGRPVAACSLLGGARRGQARNSPLRKDAAAGEIRPERDQILRSVPPPTWRPVPGGLLVHADGAVAGCTNDDEPDGCAGRELRHEGNPNSERSPGSNHYGVYDA